MLALSEEQMAGYQGLVELPGAAHREILAQDPPVQPSGHPEETSTNKILKSSYNYRVAHK